MTWHTITPAWENHLITLAQEAHHPIGDHPTLFPAPSEDPTLTRAYQTCETITAQHSRSFHLASGLLPKEKRRAMRALYAFCRTADDLADSGVIQPEARLDHLRQSVRGALQPAGDPVLTAWADIRQRYQIPLRYAEQLLEGVSRDLAPHRYRTFDELSVYCYSVASTVGLMSMHITGFSSTQAIPYAIKLGVALQLTNILRDVGEDWAAGRLYLPLDELEAFGLSEADLAAQKVDPRWHAFMRFQIARNRLLYREAMPGIAWLHPDGRFAVAAAANLYRGILDDIEAHDYAVFNRRAYVSRGAKLRTLLRTFVSLPGRSRYHFGGKHD